MSKRRNANAAAPAAQPPAIAAAAAELPFGHFIGLKHIQARPEARDEGEGYEVLYPDGYRSWSPAEAFQAYHEVPAAEAPEILAGARAALERLIAGEGETLQAPPADAAIGAAAADDDDDEPVAADPAGYEDPPEAWLGRVADHFRARFPDDWEQLRLCPLQHGLETMAELLKHRG